MKSIGFWLLALPALLLGCSSTPRALEMEHRAILAQDQAWASAAAAKDVERTVAYWADDATLMPPDMPPLKGKDEIRQYVVAGFKMAGFSVAWDARDVVVAPGGKMAYEIGTNRFTIADSTGTL